MADEALSVAGRWTDTVAKLAGISEPLLKEFQTPKEPWPFQEWHHRSSFRAKWSINSIVHRYIQVL